MAFVLIIITACGGSEESSTLSSNGSDALVGKFIDSPVEGLRYFTKSQSGYTNQLGEFLYRSGEVVTFSIGGFELGKSIGSSNITPLSLTGDTDIQNVGVESINIARLLQSLDEEPNNLGKIKISALLDGLDMVNIGELDLESDTNLSIILNSATNITSVAYSLIDSDTALTAMQEYINLVNTYEMLTNGRSYLFTGSQYYLVTMPNEGNLLVTGQNMLHTLYDTSLNRVDSYPVNTALSAGSYILNIRPSNASSSTPSQFELYSPAIFEANNLPLLSSGESYSFSGSHFYQVTLESEGNLLVTGQNMLHTLYDTSLNRVDSYPVNTALSAGSYILNIRPSNASSSTPSQFELYSPAILEASNLPLLSSGESYSFSGSHFYQVTLESEGNLLVTGQNMLHTLYDTSLNRVDSYPVNTALSAGSYILNIRPSNASSSTSSTFSIAY